MSGPRIYVDAALTNGECLTLPAQASQHVLRVLRLRPGAELTLFNGRGGEFGAVLQATTVGGGNGRGAVVNVAEYRAVERESPLMLCLLQSLARGERMDFILQKATELGVSRIVPVMAERSVVRLDEAQARRRLTHWHNVIVGACEQCGRNRLPELATVSEFAAAVSAPSAGAAHWLLDPAAAHSLGSQLMPSTRAAVLLVGPEGGLSAAERELALSSGFVAVSLGPRVLRTETAPLAALAAIQALAGDWR